LIGNRPQSATFHTANVGGNQKEQPAMIEKTMNDYD
jgi:hypothetical protein